MYVVAMLERSRTNAMICLKNKSLHHLHHGSEAAAIIKVEWEKLQQPGLGSFHCLLSSHCGL